MPAPTLPPTPAASADLVGKEDVLPSQQDLTFDLPSPVYDRESVTSTHTERRKTQPRSSVQSSPADPFPTPKTISKKRTASQAALGRDDLYLPPPPGRSRKIIQMKPKESDTSSTGKGAPASASSAATAKPNGNGIGKKKQGATTAGRKIARKTAHSLIERRRRSKMNEEFATLKDMIPACAGQDMHKLAILQASIDYMRYLEQCLSDVKAGKQADCYMAPSNFPTISESNVSSPSDTRPASVREASEHESHTPTTGVQSPPIFQGGLSGPTVYSSAVSSTAPSPSFSPYSHHPSSRSSLASKLKLPPPSSAGFGSERNYAPHDLHNPAPLSQSHSNQASPTILPQSSHSSAPSELDQEASAALLMLNASDRRGSLSKGTAPIKDKPPLRGISVKDLLRS